VIHYADKAIFFERGVSSGSVLTSISAFRLVPADGEPETLGGVARNGVVERLLLDASVFKRETRVFADVMASA
jgi:hypothetical protein